MVVVPIAPTKALLSLRDAEWLVLKGDTRMDVFLRHVADATLLSSKDMSVSTIKTGTFLVEL